MTTLAVGAASGPGPTWGADRIVIDVAGYRVDAAPAGRGRFGSRLAAVRRRDGSAVTVELLDLAPEQTARALAELSALLDLPDSPHLLPVLDVGATDDGRVYVTAPRAERSLAAADGVLTAEALRVAATDAALGLVALHGADLLHGALAPESVVALANGRWALTAPVVPVLAEADAGPHRPPEVRRGGDWSVAGDLWALGSTLRAVGALPDDVGDLVAQLLADDPVDRPRSAQEVVDRLRPNHAGPRPGDPLATAGPGAPVRTVREPAGRPLGSGYLLVEPVGRGATGQVWRGLRRRDGAPVAIKLLRAELAEDPEVVARFLAERSVVTGVASPYVVRVHDLVAESGTLAIVMDLVDGADLRRTLADGALSRDDGVRVLAQVARGLAAVHAAGIVHRDLKPENVLVGRSAGAAHAWLTDFGVARSTAGPSSARLTRASRLVGTPEYVAPELAAGRAATAAADVYAWGVLAYEVLSGRRPFDAEHPAALLRAHLEDAPARPPELAEPVWTVLSACLAKDPDERPDALTVAERLEASAGSVTGDRALAPLPGPAERATPPPYLPQPLEDAPLPTSDATRPAPPPPPAQQPRRDRRRLWAGAALLVIALAAAGVGAWLGRPDPEPPASRPRPTVTTGPVAVAVVADSPRRGDVRLRFPDGGGISGVQFFSVVRSGTLAVPHVDAGDREWTVHNLDPGTRWCWQVVAFVRTTGQLPKRDVGAAPCLLANGKPQ